MQKKPTLPIRTLALVLVLCFTYVFHAQAQKTMSDTLEVRFRVGQSDIDLSYADNARRIDAFTDIVKRRYANASREELQLNIFTGASPEGPDELNRRLGEERGRALKALLRERLGEGIHIAVYNEGARWGQLADRLYASKEPWAWDALKVLSRSTEKDGWKRDPREDRLRKLDGGRVWSHLEADYLPALRSSGSAIIMQLNRRQIDTLVIRDTIIYKPEPCKPYVEPADTRPVWAIKTNFLLWGVVAPNIQIERALGKNNRWSLEAEVFWPWWTWNHNFQAEQFGNVGLELRYWLGNRKNHHSLDGWHLGLAAAAGYYDFEWKKHKGYQGEYTNTYLNLGYQHRFGKNKHWAIDGGIGFGWIATNRRYYLGSSVFPVGYEEERDDHLMWQNTKWRHFIGATHLNVSIAYMFGARKRKDTAPDGQFMSQEQSRKQAAEAEKARKKAEKARKKEEKTRKKQHEAELEAAWQQEKARRRQAKIEARADRERAEAEAKIAREQEKAKAKADRIQAEAMEKIARIQAGVVAKADNNK